MIIHTTKNGENLYSIARRYSVPATKILGDNGLYGDRITIGDQLLILIPTRTETVRAKDTLDTFSKRFGVRKDMLLMANPSLMGKDKLRPGQIITVKQSAPTLGTGAALGFVNKGCRRDFLRRAIPYTTYITVNSAIIENDGIKANFDDRWASDICKQERKIHLLGVKDTTNGAFLSDKTKYKKLIDDMISLAKKNGYKGITVSAEGAADKRGDEFCDFLLEMRKSFIGCDMLLFTEVFDTTPSDASELSDGAILHLNYDLPIADLKRRLTQFSESAESSKVFINISSTTSLSDSEISIDDAKELCYRCGKELSFDNESLIQEFIYTRYRIGKGENIKIEFPSLKYTKAKLEHLAELGFMGISFDADTVPIAILAMFSSEFARADYSLPADFG